MPSAKVTRPETTSHQRANVVHSTGSSGRLTFARITIMPATVAVAVPASTAVVRTPSPAMMYGDRMLYEAGCMPPYQDRLYEAEGCARMNSVHAYWAAMSPESLARKSAHRMCSTADRAVASTTGCRQSARLRRALRPRTARRAGCQVVT